MFIYLFALYTLLLINTRVYIAPPLRTKRMHACLHNEINGWCCTHFFWWFFALLVYCLHHLILIMDILNIYNEAVFCLQARKPLHGGSYEHRVPKIKTKHFFVCMCVCLIQHRSWPLRSTILNAHDTNASPDGLCTRTHTNEAFSCWFCCKSFRVDLEIDLVWVWGSKVA